MTGAELSKRLAVEIGGTRLLASAEHVWLETSGAMRLFRCPAEHPDVDLTVELADLSGPARGRLLFRSGGLWDLRRDGDELVFHFTSPAFGPHPYRSARFDLGIRRGLVQVDAAYTPAPRPVVAPFAYPLDELLIMHRLAQGQGIELHACGILDEKGDGFLFVGQSGAGKTTTAGSWLAHRPGVVLSDDRIVVRIERGGPMMYGTPWHGEASLAAARSAPLKAIYLLHKASAPRVVAVRAVEAVSRLLACSFVPFYSGEALGFSLEFLRDLVGRVPCAELHLQRDPAFLELLSTGTE